MKRGTRDVVVIATIAMAMMAILLTAILIMMEVDVGDPLGSKVLKNKQGEPRSIRQGIDKMTR